MHNSFTCKRAEAINPTDLQTKSGMLKSHKRFDNLTIILSLREHATIALYVLKKSEMGINFILLFSRL